MATATKTGDEILVPATAKHSGTTLLAYVHWLTLVMVGGDSIAHCPQAPLSVSHRMTHWTKSHLRVQKGKRINQYSATSKKNMP